MTFVCPSSAQISTLSGRSRADRGAATITGVPAAGLPNRTSVVSRNFIPTALASALWSITAKTFRPFALRMPVRREVVSVTDLGLILVVISVSIQSVMALSPVPVRAPSPLPAMSLSFGTAACIRHPTTAGLMPAMPC